MLTSDAAQALAKIAGQPENSPLITSVADRFMFQDYYGDRTPSAIAKEFGPQFAVALEKLKPGSWQGPIESGFGWHLVFVRYCYSRPSSGFRGSRVRGENHVAG